jgi:hypothetical protein
MTTIKKLTATRVTVGVWLAAVGSAAALMYDLNRTPHLASDPAQSAAPSHLAPPLLAPPASESQPVLYVPPVTIVGRPHRPTVASAPKRLNE